MWARRETGISVRKNFGSRGDVASIVKWSTKGATERSQGIHPDGNTERILCTRHGHLTLLLTCRLALPQSSLLSEAVVKGEGYPQLWVTMQPSSLADRIGNGFEGKDL